MAEHTSRLLKLSEVMKLTGLGISSIYRKIAEGAFPAPLQISSGCVRWDAAVLAAWKEKLPVSTEETRAHALEVRKLNKKRLSYEQLELILRVVTEALDRLSAEEWRDDDDPILQTARQQARTALHLARCSSQVEQPHV